MHIADLLSRSFIDKIDTDSNDWITEIVHSIETGLKISDAKKVEYQKATRTDPVSSKIKQYHCSGWPNSKDQLEDAVKFYYNLQDQLTVEDDLVFLNFRLVVPQILRKSILELLHESHFGVTKTKTRAKEVVYWPGMGAEIENLIARCPVCEKYSNSNVKEPLIPHDIPNIPFNKVASDI